MKITILAIGKIKGSYADLCNDYCKRINFNMNIKELSAVNQKAEGKALLAALPDKSFVVLLDEHGKDLNSRDMAKNLQIWLEKGIPNIVFMIGGADGHTKEVKERADFVLGLGNKTWPHKLVRIMLLEQIYRSQQINSGHPYHRD